MLKMYTFQWVYLWEYVHSASRHRSYCIICCTRSEFAPFINLVNTSCCHCCCCCCFQHHWFQFLFNWQIFLELSWVRSHKSELSGNCWSLQAGCPTCHQTSCIIALMGRRIHVNLPYFTSPYLTSALALCANKFNYICLLVIYFRTPFSLYVQLMNTTDRRIDVCDFDRHAVLAVMRYLYIGDVDIQRPLIPEVSRFATRYHLWWFLTTKD